MKLFNFIENKNSDIVEIVHSPYNPLINSKFKDNTIVSMSLVLSIGDLSKINNCNREYLKKIYKDGNFYYKKELEKLKNIVNNAKKIRIWSSHLDDNEYLLLLYLCNIFYDKELYVVFSEEYNCFCYSICCMTPNEIEQLSYKEHKITKQDLSYYNSEWVNALIKNTEYRYVNNGKIENVNFAFFYDKILDKLKEVGPIITRKFVGDLMADKIMNNSSDVIYLYIIDLLIEMKKIRVIESGENNLKVINEKKDPRRYNIIYINQ